MVQKTPRWGVKTVISNEGYYNDKNQESPSMNLAVRTVQRPTNILGRSKEFLTDNEEIEIENSFENQMSLIVRREMNNKVNLLRDELRSYLTIIIILLVMILFKLQK